jgi:hypothetical protein
MDHIKRQHLFCRMHVHYGGDPFDFSGNGVMAAEGPAAFTILL